MPPQVSSPPSPPSASTERDVQPGNSRVTLALSIPLPSSSRKTLGTRTATTQIPKQRPNRDLILNNLFLQSDQKSFFTVNLMQWFPLRQQILSKQPNTSTCTCTQANRPATGGFAIFWSNRKLETDFQEQLHSSLLSEQDCNFAIPSPPLITTTHRSL